MPRIYNRPSEKEKRRRLRKNMTKAEVLLWIKLKNHQLLGLRVLRQYSVGAYILDFYIPKIRLAIEVDGATHVTDHQRAYDRRRQKEIESLGIQFLRVKNPEIYDDMNGVLEKIRQRAVGMSGGDRGETNRARLRPDKKRRAFGGQGCKLIDTD